MNQINGVARLLNLIQEGLSRYVGWDVRVVTADEFTNFPFPTYPEIRLAYPHQQRIKDCLDAFQPDHVHILTEGPLGYGFRYVCNNRNIHISTHYCTNMPAVLGDYAYLPRTFSYQYLKHFHQGAQTTLVQSKVIQEELRANGIERTSLVVPGIDDARFRQEMAPPLIYNGLRRPILLCVSRLSHEKNVDDFCRLPAELGSKVVIGDGPLRESLENAYPEVHFLGSVSPEDIAPFYKYADCFVFPSHKDTFGLVLLEAIAAGIPVAAYNACPGAQQVVHQGVGALDQKLESAVMRALSMRIAPQAFDSYYGAEGYAKRFSQSLVKCQP